MDQKLVAKMDEAVLDLAKSIHEEAGGAKSAQTAFKAAMTVCKRSLALKRAIAAIEGKSADA